MLMASEVEMEQTVKLGLLVTRVQMASLKALWQGMEEMALPVNLALMECREEMALRAEMCSCTLTVMHRPLKSQECVTLLLTLEALGLKRFCL